MENWEPNESTYPSNVDDARTFEPPSDGGKSYGKGRGFTPQRTNNQGNSWKNDDSMNNDHGDRRGRGGRGGGRSFRGGNDRGNRRNDDWGKKNYQSGNGNGNDDDSGDVWKSNDDGWGKKNHGEDNFDGDDNGFNSGGGNRGRGGGRGGRGGSRNRNSDEANDEEKRPPIYIPKERTEDELFDDGGIDKGINFGAYRNIVVNVTGSNVPPPINSFADANLRSVLLQNLQRAKYDEPTPVQKYAIPIIIDGRDLMATAQTGSGKTAAFLLPIINRIFSDNTETSGGEVACEPMAIVLSPTRELTTQIYEVGRKFCHSSFLKVHQIYGGTSVGFQIRQVSNGCHILIATPGRLGDFLNRNVISFKNVKFVVLDEADRMLDMGFRSDIETFLRHPSMREDHQTLMFSATFSGDIQKLAAKYLNDYLFLTVGKIGVACKDVEQNILAVPKNDKKRALKELIEEQSNVRGTLLFVETKRNADFVASYLSSQEVPTTSIHGDRYQQQREEALRGFKSGEMHILVATSVAARGLDIKGVKHVVNYDLPDSIDEYVHRIGRTGRLGNKGRATSFYDQKFDARIATELVSILEQADQEVPDFLRADASGESSFKNNEFGGYDIRESNATNFKTDCSNMPEQIRDETTW